MEWLTLAPLRRIWVDLLPLQAGGANGGAKPFILSLLTQLAAARPEVEFRCSVQPTLTEALPKLEAAANLSYVPLRRHHWRARPAGTQLVFCPFGPPLVASHGLPVVSIFYDLLVLAYPMFFRIRERRQRQRHLQQLRRRSQRIAAISQFSRQEGLRHGLDPERVQVIPIQIPPVPPRTPSGPPHELPPGSYLLFPANLWPHKNHELLFTAFAMARAQGLPTQIKLVCTGDDRTRRADLNELCRGLGLEGQVVFPGYVDSNALETLYAHSLAVVFPSLYEGFGMPVIEAMARQIPVCCSNSTALAEVAGDAALLIDPRHPQQIATAMLRLSRDASLREQLVIRGAERARRYQQPEAMVAAYWRLLEEAHQAGPLQSRPYRNAP